MQCPQCKSEKVTKVIWLGLPFKFCEAPGCCSMWGFWDFIFEFIPFDGKMLAYQGSYVKAFWHWLWADLGA